ESPVAYLLVPDRRALEQIERLWRIWLAGQDLPNGFTPWRDVFACLRDIRPWGPADRVQPPDASVLGEEIFGKEDDAQIPLEIEIVFRRTAEMAELNENAVARAVVANGGTIISRARLDEIAYHAVLARLPLACIKKIIDRSPASWAGI